MPKDQALLLSRRPFSESSLVVSVLTRHHGPVRLLARGAHRPRSRYFGVLDAFHTLELVWNRARHGELHHLAAGELSVRRRRILEDLEHYAAANAMVELTALGMRPGMAETAQFDALSEALDQLEAGELPADTVRVRFELGFLRRHGLSPALERCAACGQGAPARGGRAPFSAGAGGRLCVPCADEARSQGRRVGTLPLDVLDAAARMLAGAESELTPELALRLRDFVERFLGVHLENRPRALRAFLAQGNRNAPAAPR